MYLQTILHPTDFTEPSQAALRYAVALARNHGARLVILHVAGPLARGHGLDGGRVPPPPGAGPQRLREDVLQGRPKDPLIPLEYILCEGDPASAIVRVARERGCDLIVLGSHGRDGWRRWLKGSVAEQVTRRAPCPVLVVKAAMAPRLVPRS